MDQRSIDRFSQAVRDEVFARLGASSVREVGGFESFVFEADIAGARRIIKVTDGLRRTAAQLHGELDFVDYLARNGAAVARPVRSPGGELVESIPTTGGPPFLAYAFEKAPGSLTRADLLSDDLIEHYGAVTGRLHALTKDYAPARADWRRDDWQADWILEEKYLPAAARERAAALLERIARLPRDRDCYGLLHTDLHNGNLFLHDERFTVIDFDDCAYAWFVYDIAVVLYYAAWFFDEGDREDFARYFLARFLSGYARENKLDPAWLERIPDFLLFRSLVMVRVAHEMLAGDQPPRWRRVAERILDVVENGTPILPLDYASFAGFLR